MTFAIVGPSKGQDLALAASRQQKQADRGHLKRTAQGMVRQPHGQPAKLLIRQETLAPLPAVAPDAPAGVGPLGPETHRFPLPAI